MKACNLASCAAMRASSASTTVTGDSRRAAISAARRWAGKKLGSALAAGMGVSVRRRGKTKNIHRAATPPPQSVGRLTLGLQVRDAHDGNRPAVIEGDLFR